MMQKLKIMICMGSSCFARGNEDNLRLIEDYIRKHQLEERIDLSGRCCAKQCAEGPNISIDGILYNRISKEQLLKLLDEKFLAELKK
ncbi:MAG: (2Fe-2S) ferredoxin domain-containing protein [Lentisphaeria bacterium]|nr:(2Fe-2S) ferredoxin domain-containing protein [Lentisphaeria bacterium]